VSDAQNGRVGRWPAKRIGAHVRLAELVAALSLGIDLGFGQPMEHVLRQSLISLRVADLIGLGEPERGVVYYTARPAPMSTPPRSCAPR
jgi:hypothetical protein